MSMVKDWFWPDVSIRRKAQGAIDEAFWVALAIAAFGAIVVLIEYMRYPGDGFNGPGLLEALCFAGLAFGIRLRSRAAAVSAFSLYVLNAVYGLLLRPSLSVIPVVVACALFAGVRGTFAYQKFPPKPENLPTVSESFKAMKTPPAAPPPTPPE